jgi:hypothetical protein
VQLKVKAKNFMGLHTYDEGESSVRRGASGEAAVSKFLRSLGYKTVRSIKSKGIFDITATRGDSILLVQVKARSVLTAAASRPYKDHKRYLGAEAPEGARKLHWGYHFGTNLHYVYEVTPETFVKISPTSLA